MADAPPDQASSWTLAAGSFWAARANLLAGNPQKFAPYLKRAALHRTTFHGLVAANTLGMRIERFDAARHDMHVAYVSHVSHAISYALALTVLEKERDETQIFNLASGGFGSTARLAKSSADMWTPIFLHNRDNILAAIDTYMAKLGALRSAIERRDDAALRALIAAANDIRRVLR